MSYKLVWELASLNAMAEYRAHDPVLAAAFERTLDELRATGNARGGTFVGGEISAHVSRVSAPHHVDHVVIWTREPDDRPKIVYLGPLDA